MSSAHAVSVTPWMFHPKVVRSCDFIEPRSLESQFNRLPLKDGQGATGVRKDLASRLEARAPDRSMPKLPPPGRGLEECWPRVVLRLA